MAKQFLIICFIVCGWLNTQTVFAQETRPTQTIRGLVTDVASDAPLSLASIKILNTDIPATATNAEGQFVLPNIPVGRYDLQVSFMGYETEIVKDIVLTSAKEVNLEIRLKEHLGTLGEVVIRARVDKSRPLNKMTLTGARMLSTEEASRFAGGMDDPARLVSAYAGVASGLSDNGISIHGNSPGFLQWRLEDVEIPNPNHFADIGSYGGGLLTSLSSNLLGNSDFYTSAFPAEYNNAISGIFDMRLRNGNNQRFQHTFQLGILGINAASEGPLDKQGKASYIFNYRYSTVELLSKLSKSKDMSQSLNYQDLNFKLNFPTAHAGTFSFWTTALIDKVGPQMRKPSDWEYAEDAKDSRAKQTSAAAGLSHHYLWNNGGMLKTTLALTFSETNVWEGVYDALMNAKPVIDFKVRYTNAVLNSFFNKKYSSRHTNKTGVTITNMHYDMRFDMAPYYQQPLQRLSEGQGNTVLGSVYSSSLFNLSDDLSATVGINGQFLTLNKHWTLEPRLALKWQMTDKNSLGFAYGLYSRMEKLDVYFVKNPTTGQALVNKDLDFTRSQNVSLSYQHRLSENLSIKIEPYYQYLTNIPVVAGSSYSLINRRSYYIGEQLVSEGRGYNYGVDVTLEKYMSHGLYYMVTASLFDSRYRGGDGKWYNTRFNRHYILNGLVGKEWMIGRSKRNVLSVNLRASLQGGDRYSPVNIPETLAHPDKETIYDERRAFQNELSPIFMLHYSISYRINCKKISHEFALKGLNATNYREYSGHAYNLHTGVIEPRRMKTTILNLLYRIDF
jgi:hypothetical protein bacD2_17630